MHAFFWKYTGVQHTAVSLWVVSNIEDPVTFPSICWFCESGYMFDLSKGIGDTA